MLLLDYDGTLVALEPTGSTASPDDALRTLLTQLGDLPNVDVHVVSGRPRDTLAAWLADLPVSLHAEHGAASRGPNQPWEAPPSPQWLSGAQTMLARWAEAHPGAWVEAKVSAMAVHYRCAVVTEHDLAVLDQTVSSWAREVGLVSVLPGSGVVEVRADDTSKGNVVRRLIQASPDAGFFIAGDDVTDEDMFAAARDVDVTVHVGRSETRARHRLTAPAELRILLESFLARRTRRAGDAALTSTTAA